MKLFSSNFSKFFHFSMDRFFPCFSSNRVFMEELRRINFRIDSIEARMSLYSSYSSAMILDVPYSPAGLNSRYRTSAPPRAASARLDLHPLQQEQNQSQQG